MTKYEKELTFCRFCTDKMVDYIKDERIKDESSNNYNSNM